MYDSWGNILEEKGEPILRRLNPLRYRGYVYDEDTTLYYLQSRYYDPKTGRFINADDTAYIGSSGTVLSCNIFVYCENNPINLYDYTGNCCYLDGGIIKTCHKSNKYNRNNAIKYAEKWSDDYNMQFPKFQNGDCANFVSQCLHYGGLNMNRDWYCFKSSYWEECYTQYWTVASKQYAYFRRSKYVKRSIELSWYNLTNTIQHKIINKYGIKKGDLLYFDGNGDGIYTHASIISSIIKVKGKKIICYAAHTVSRFNKKLLSNKDKKNPKKNKGKRNSTVCILQMK